ncbi:hypothetical protein LguiA_025290 [Lonicera macranthoides]
MGLSSSLFKLSLSYLFVLLPSYTSIATNTLSPTQNLTDGSTLISSNQRFELGFFSPGNSTNRYLGIWYHNLPLTVVWVANRQNPIADFSGELTLKNNGALLLYDRSMAVIWSTNLTDKVNNPVLQLLNSGNLVVKNDGDDDDFVWESFDYLSDTLLPGMKLGWKLKLGFNRNLTSWKSNEDPSNGEFSFSLDPAESPQLTLRRLSEKLYRWGPFDGDRFSGSNELRPNSVFEPLFIYNSDEVYYRYNLLDDSVLSRFVVNPMGSIQYFTWSDHRKEWAMMVTLNREYCDRYGLCGTYGNCFTDDPNCRCLKGFTPNLPSDWRIFDSKGGCKRNHELNCSNGDGFVKFVGLKLPDNATVWPNYSNEECRMECLKNCGCMAHASVNVHANGSQCVVWLDDLIDIRYIPNGGEDLYIRMARAELESIATAKRRKLVVKISIIVISSIFGMLLTSFVWYIYQKKRGTWKGRTVRKWSVFSHLRFLFLGTLLYLKSCKQENNSYKYSKQESQQDNSELPLFDLDTILAATGKFCLQNRIGQGGFGTVYRGELPNGQEIAVKRLSQNSMQGLQELKNELTLIAKLQHRNLVRLLGCCIKGEEQMLVYEYLPNKSLDGFILDLSKRKLLHWKKRFEIITGIARGLLYLHQDSIVKIIHRDLKTSNILLDSEMNPKISDFGIARIFGGDQTEEKTKRVIGTYGYMSPEYAMSGHFSVKSDVFSFGVIVLEIISGQKNWLFHHPDHDLNLIGHAWKLWDEENPLELVDSLLDESFCANEVKRCIHMALLCVQQRAEDRPTMSSVVFMLGNENVVLAHPKEPGFAIESSSKKFDSSTSGQHSSSTANEITITTMDGR